MLSLVFNLLMDASAQFYWILSPRAALTAGNSRSSHLPLSFSKIGPRISCSFSQFTLPNIGGSIFYHLLWVVKVKKKVAELRQTYKSENISIFTEYKSSNFLLSPSSHHFRLMRGKSSRVWSFVQCNLCQPLEFSV